MLRRPDERIDKGPKIRNLACCPVAQIKLGLTRIYTDAIKANAPSLNYAWPCNVMRARFFHASGRARQEQQRL